MKYIVLYILCFKLFTVQGNAQESISIPGKVKMAVTTPMDYHAIFSQQFDFNFSLKQSWLNQNAGFIKYPSINHLPGIFCKLEYKIETKSKLAPRFRLGSLAYTEWMEGKQDFYSRFYK